MMNESTTAARQASTNQKKELVIPLVMTKPEGSSMAFCLVTKKGKRPVNHQIELDQNSQIFQSA